MKIISVAVENLCNGDIFERPQSQKMLQEPVDAWAAEASLPYFLSPEVGLESHPESSVQFISIRSSHLRFSKQQILDQISGQQLRSVVIESLEDNLWIIIRFKIDHHELQLVTDHFPKGFLASLQLSRGQVLSCLSRIVFLNPLHQDIAEIPIGVRHAHSARNVFREAQTGYKDFLGSGRHCCLEDITIAIRRPNFENVGRRLTKLDIVLRQLLKATCKLRQFILVREIAESGHEDLQCRETLLTVNNLTGFN